MNVFSQEEIDADIGFFKAKLQRAIDRPATYGPIYKAKQVMRIVKQIDLLEDAAVVYKVVRSPS